MPRPDRFVDRPEVSDYGTSPLVNQSNRGPGWSFSSAMNPSTGTELYIPTLP